MTKERLTTDHLTPRCIAKELKWTYWQINDKMNLQKLTWPEHAKKDESTPSELYWVKFHGGGKTLWQHYNEQIWVKKKKYGIR